MAPGPASLVTHDAHGVELGDRGTCGALSFLVGSSVWTQVPDSLAYSCSPSPASVPHRVQMISCHPCPTPVTLCLGRLSSCAWQQLLRWGEWWGGSQVAPAGWGRAVGSSCVWDESRDGDGTVPGTAPCLPTAGLCSGLVRGWGGCPPLARWKVQGQDP